jgi:hypothetical protein
MKIKSDKIAFLICEDGYYWIASIVKNVNKKEHLSIAR